MAKLTRDQITATARAAGFTGQALEVAVAVALAESGGNTRAISSTGDYGLWQINHRWHPTYDTGRLLSDPAYNAAAAYSISKSGADWSPWTTYKTGAYKRHMGGTGTDTKTTNGGGGIEIPDLSIGDIAGDVGDALGGAATSWVEPLIARAGTAALALILTSAGLALIGLGLSRLVSSSATVNDAMSAAGTVATTAAII